MSARKPLFLLVILLSGLPSPAQNRRTEKGLPALRFRIQQITARPEFKSSQWGIEFYDLSGGKVVMALSGEKLFTPGSTTKLLTEGTALALLGPEYRFRTRVYRTGPVTADGTLQGDLVLVAAGDPNLSARARPDDTLAFTNADHLYAGLLPADAVPGDPLIVLKEMARQVSEHGIHRIEGRVLVDDSLFTANKTEPEGSAISPIMVNDNLIDVMVTPSATVGGPTSIQLSPLVPYLSVINKTTTVDNQSDARMQFASETTGPDGMQTAALEGAVPVGSPSLVAYRVKNPVRFAECAFLFALHDAGILVNSPLANDRADFKSLAASYTAENMVAEHLSAPLKAEVKVTLKASQNLHAAMMPYFLGAVLAHDSDNALEAGFKLEREFLRKAGLNLSQASQVDGPGGPGTAFTPDFMVRYLAYLAKQPYAPSFVDALPVMGRDGTLAYLQQKSPAAGHVHAKSGTYVYYDPLNHSLLLSAKALAGYIDTRGGHKLAFAIYVNQVPAASMDDVEAVGERLGEIATAAYEQLP